ncbi:hypothetical protein C0J52_15728 [Blattella germanica]|nr:hypothetical protein C0J52_15728 [Blattella germanica]
MLYWGIIPYLRQQQETTPRHYNYCVSRLTRVLRKFAVLLNISKRSEIFPQRRIF